MHQVVAIQIGIACLLATAIPAQAATPPSSSHLRPSVDVVQSQVAAPDVVVELRVHGNHSIPDEDVIRLAGVESGAVLGVETIPAIEARLRRSGRFERVEVRKRFRSLTATNEVVLIVVVQERPSDLSLNPMYRAAQLLARKSLIMPLVTYEEGYGFSYGVRASAIDLLGAGERLSMPLTWGGTRRAALELEREFTRGVPSRLRTSAALSSREDPHFEVGDRRVELLASLDSEIVTGVRLEGTAGWTDVEFGEIRDRFVSYGLGLSVDTREDPTFPRDAVFASAGWGRLEVLDGGASVGRTRLEARAYKGVVGQAVFSVRALYQGADRSLPVYEQSFLGGGATVRGYSLGQFIGDNVAVGSAELRMPLTSPLDIGNAGVSLFFDTGAAYDVGQRIRKTRFHQGPPDPRALPHESV